jgi:hypothetical protein
LAWELNGERRRLGFGELVAVHQLGHPENRKQLHEYDYHDRYNAKVDAPTHELTLDMPLYVSFKRMGRAQTRVWYEPLEQENVGRGTCREVTSDVYKHIAKSAQRRASIARTHSHEEEFLATFCKGVAGCPSSVKASSFMSKLIHEHLATEPRILMWGGATRGVWTCGCGKRMT